MKFTIIGSTFTGNKGAAAMLESSIQTLSAKYDDAEFVLLSISPKADKKLNPYKNVKVMSAKPLYLGLVINPVSILYRLLPFMRGIFAKISPEVKELHESAALLDEGGITFSDGREKYLIFNVATILPAMILGTKVIKISQALGSFKNPINRFVSKLILPKVTLIISRGDRTHEFLEGLNLTNIKRGADFAFSLDMTDSSKKEAEAYIKEKNNIFENNQKVVGISPSVVVKGQMDKANMDYIKITADFLNGLIAKGYSIALVPHSVRLNTTKTHNNDLPLTKELYELINDKGKVLLIDDELDSQQLRYIIGKCDYFIASRFHAMISSLAMQVPTMVVGWSHKYGEVLKMFDMQDYVMNYKETSVEKLNNVFEELLKNESAIKDKFSKHWTEVKEKSLKNVDYIGETIKEQ